LAVVCGGQLSWAHWADLTLARARLAAGLRVNGSSAPQAVASLILFAVAIAICAFAVPVMATAIDALATGRWPWWLVPLGRCVLKVRLRWWVAPRKREERAVVLLDKSRQAEARRHRGRAALYEALSVRLNGLAKTADIEPKLYTWSADRFEATRKSIEASNDLKITERWTDLLLVMPDTARAILTAARDSYDGACEALTWSAAVFVLGFWWPPAFVGGFPAAPGPSAPSAARTAIRS
jgi:hypothetical protein